MIRMGIITKEEALTHPDRHAINRHLGVADDRHCTPQLYPPIGLNGGDVFLICSDGVTDMVADSCLERILGDGTLSPGEAAEQIYGLALENGGEDNTTAMVVRIGITDELQDAGGSSKPGWLARLLGRGGRVRGLGERRTGDGA